jgi:hypothetical protein
MFPNQPCLVGTSTCQPPGAGRLVKVAADSLISRPATIHIHRQTPNRRCSGFRFIITEGSRDDKHKLTYLTSICQVWSCGR